MKIAIIGGGISGMSAALFIQDFAANFLIKSADDISLYADKLGGEFSSGGLKYIHNTDDTRYFIGSVLELDYQIKKVNGALWHKGKLRSFPEYLYFDSLNKDSDIQNKYWNKTRGTETDFDDRCMNEPWRFRNELMLYPSNDIVDTMKNFIEGSDIKKFYLTVDKKLLVDIIKENDLVIYTIPFHMLAEAYGIELDEPDAKTKPTQLHIERFRVVSNEQNIWCDYIYVTDAEYKFHRISKHIGIMGGVYIDVEYNDHNFNIYDQIKNYEKLKQFLFNNFGSVIEDYSKWIMNRSVQTFQIKGQIKNDLSQKALSKIPKNVMLLGRFAEMNKKVTFDKVLEKLYLYVKNIHSK